MRQPQPAFRAFAANAKSEDDLTHTSRNPLPLVLAAVIRAVELEDAAN
jgi:hypothetical protein